MKEIKFRGQSAYDGDWHYGFYREFSMPSCWADEAYKDGINYYIDEKGSNESYLVVPSTIGQFTGLEDKNGAEIYEGDIVREQSKRFKNRYFIVEWLSGIGSYSFQPVDKKAKSWPCFNIGTAKNLEIVGNIYENKELLEE